MTSARVNLLEPTSSGSMYEVKQVGLDLEDGNVDWSFGPIRNFGKFDKQTLDLEITPAYIGIEARVIKGNLRDGLGVKINYLQAKGEQKWYMKNGNELWTRFDVSITFNGHYESDRKILTF
ncbi:hypothetical protein ACHAPU_007850 [Fusarium lateritium]